MQVEMDRLAAEEVMTALTEEPTRHFRKCPASIAVVTGDKDSEFRT